MYLMSKLHRDQPLLQVKDLHVYFDVFEGTVKVLNGVFLTIRRSEAVSLVGETGCGKSVTAKTIIRIIPFARIVKGQILYMGRNLLKMNEDELCKIRGREITMIFQNPMTALNPVFTVGSQLRDVVKFTGKKKVGFLEYFRKNKDLDKEVEEKILKMLEHVRLPSDVIDKYPSQLSGGMRQRVLIAMALINNPKLVIADEPGTALDPTLQDQILKLLKEKIQEFKTSVLYITHNLGIVRELSQRIYVMYAGNVIETALTNKLFRSPSHPYTVGLLEAVPKLTGEMEKGIPGRVPDYENPPTGCRFHPRCSFAMPICKKEFPKPVEIEAEHWVCCHLYKK